MTTLTQKQESFCIAYIETGNATEAYRRSYSTSNMKEKSVNNKAHGLLKKVEIGARLAELRAPATANAQQTLEGHLNRLAQIRDSALADKKWTAAAQCEISIGKCCGFYVEQLNVTGQLMPSIEVSFLKVNRDGKD